MKIWNINAAKFYSETMNALASFFGLDAETSTEAELHQKLVDAKTIEDVRTQAVADMKTQMESFQNQLSELNTRFEALEAVNADQL